VTREIVKFSVSECTEVAFLVDPDEWGGWQDAGVRPGDVVGEVKDAVDPAV
jgi:hypothetical protein